jgi:predicted ATP-dependent endonuclease of OLD family
VEIRKFSVKRYRSIQSAEVTLSRFSVLAGPNNEGKSNVLRAMVLGTQTLVEHAKGRTSGGDSRIRRSSYSERTGIDYRWERDFPLSLRDSRFLTTEITFHYELDAEEQEHFSRQIGTRNNETLRIRITFKRGTPQPAITVLKQRSGPKLTARSEEVAEFIGSRLGVEYVSGVRTAEDASQVVQRLLDDELSALEIDENYCIAAKAIEDLQVERLKKVGSDITETLTSFLPEIKSVRAQSVQARYRNLTIPRLADLLVDDGAETSLSAKGDGVQSLAAIALLRRAAIDHRAARFVLAIEEPEAHLHPRAVRRLRPILEQIAAEQQVVITTHSPLLIDPTDLESTVLVQNSVAKVPKDLAEVRRCLGVELQDNLRSAAVALVVEGMNDVAVVSKMLASMDNDLAQALKNGLLALEPLGGGGLNLTYHLSQHSMSACRSFVLVDNDKEGKAAIQKATKSGLLDESDYLLTSTHRLESELEDLIRPSIYLQALCDKFEIIITEDDLENSEGKWSDRLKSLLKRKGKLGNSSEEASAKEIVAKTVSRVDGVVVREDCMELVETLVVQLRRKLKLGDK